MLLVKISDLRAADEHCQRVYATCSARVLATVPIYEVVERSMYLCLGNLDTGEWGEAVNYHGDTQGWPRLIRCDRCNLVGKVPAECNPGLQAMDMNLE